MIIFVGHFLMPNITSKQWVGVACSTNLVTGLNQKIYSKKVYLWQWNQSYQPRIYLKWRFTELCVITVPIKNVWSLYEMSTWLRNFVHLKRKHDSSIVEKYEKKLKKIIIRIKQIIKLQNKLTNTFKVTPKVHITQEVFDGDLIILWYL